MTDDRKTVYVNDKPISIFLWAEIQHCVNAYDSDLYLKVRRGEAEIIDELGHRLGWGGFAGDGQHIYVRLLNPPSPPATFSGEATVESLMAAVARLADEGKIGDEGFVNLLIEKLWDAQKNLAEGRTGFALNDLDSFVLEVEAQAGVHVIPGAAAELIASAKWVIANLP